MLKKKLKKEQKVKIINKFRENFNNNNNFLQRIVAIDPDMINILTCKEIKKQNANSF